MKLTLYLPSKEIEVGLKTPSTSVHIITIKHEEAVGRRWTRNLNKLQNIMKLPMNIANKDCFTLWVYRYVHTIRLPMKELPIPNKQISEYTSSIQSAAHDRTQQNSKTSFHVKFETTKLACYFRHSWEVKTFDSFKACILTNYQLNIEVHLLVNYRQWPPIADSVRYKLICAWKWSIPVIPPCRRALKISQYQKTKTQIVSHSTSPGKSSSEPTHVNSRVWELILTIYLSSDLEIIADG